MPELPEVEHLRRTLEPALVGRRISAVRLARPDVLRSGPAPRPGRLLLLNRRIAELRRRGKHLALLSAEGPVLCLHLGMTGQLRVVPRGVRLGDATHVHCLWTIAAEQGRPGARLVFRDPRRFGGLWSYPSIEAMRRLRWDRIGPDALTIRAATLAPRLARTDRAIKVALMDQTLLAGLGNIYADEALFRSAIHPTTRASALGSDAIEALATAIRSTLRQALRAGGSTLRDFVDAGGRPGTATSGHLVYGRAGRPCHRCGGSLEGFTLGQRTTVACSHCQRQIKRR